MSDEWRNEMATEKQKEKLRFYGCTWDEGITAGQASDALEECAKQFPNAEADYQKSQPATEMQKEKLRFFGCTWNGDITVGKASEALGECARQFPDREAIWELQKRKWVKIPGTFPVKEFDQLDKTSSQEGTIQKTETVACQPVVATARSVETPQQYLERTKRANDPAWQRWAKAKQIPPPQVTIQETEIAVSAPSAKREDTPVKQTLLTYVEVRAMTQQGWHNWIALHGSYGTEPGHKLTFGEARGLSEQAWDEWKIQHGRLSLRENVERQIKETMASPSAAMWCSKCRKSNIVEHNGQHWCPDCGCFVIPAEPQVADEKRAPTAAETTDQDRRNALATKKEKEKIAGLLADDERQCLERQKKELDEWEALQEYQNKSLLEITVQEAEIVANEPATAGAPVFIPRTPEPPFYLKYSLEPYLPVEFQQTEAENRRRYEKYVAAMERWNLQRNDDAKKQPEPFPEPPKPQDINPPRLKMVETALTEVTIQEATKPQNSSPREIIPEKPEVSSQPYEMFCPACDGQIEVPSGKVGKPRTCPNCKAEVIPLFFKKKSTQNFIPAREVQEFARQKSQDNLKGDKPAYATVEECSHDRYTSPYRPAIQKPTAYISAIPIERFTKWLDIVLGRNAKCLGGHWLPVGPVFYPFKEYTTLTKGLCCQIADAIEARGYCVEPDARFGNGKYDKLHTLALFKPFDGDSIHPSTAYLGAANLLRLCILIATADGQIDLVELDVFRRAVENLKGISLTDHKRLLILEQLLVQELCSASKTAAKIAKAVPADKRLVIGKLLVEVAAANNFITDGERRVLEEIFKMLKIRHDTLEKLITEICPWPRRDVIQNDISEGDKGLWNQWRIDHPGVVIDDSTLTEKKWNFNDWKALNARWRDLHDKLAARKEQSRTPPEASSQKVSVLETFLAAGRRLGIRGKKMPEPIAVPAPKNFALDMARVYEITSETKEVVAILSVLMEDEPEKSIAPAATITLPAPEIPKVSGEDDAAPQPTRFNGLAVAFHPILERLLARDSWTKNDFKSLADEFHFMPSKIHDTLNEWSDEVLGDLILDGEDPVVIRRELMAKETIYG